MKGHPKGCISLSVPSRLWDNGRYAKVMTMEHIPFLPRKFSSRLITMTFISGLIPIVIFAILMNVFTNRFQVETDRVIQDGQAGQRHRSEVILKKMAEDILRQKALDVALQLEVYLRAYPEKTVEDLQNDPTFREIAVQPVGSGYTAVHDSATAVNRFHKDPKIHNFGLYSMANLTDFRAIIDRSMNGKRTGGYYKWREPNGKIRDKYMYIVPLRERTSDGIQFSVAATTYVEDFTHVLKVAQEVSDDTSLYMMTTIKQIIQSHAKAGFMFMVGGLILVLCLASLAGIYFSRALTALREATRAVNRGNFNVHVKPVMSGDVGELINDFNWMVARLSTTTVRKEQLKVSEEKLKNINAKLLEEIRERKRIEDRLRASEKLYRSIVENSHGGIVLIGDDYRIIYGNSEMSRITGYTPEESIGMDFREFIEGSDRELVEGRYVMRRSGKQVPQRYEFNVLQKDGGTRRVEIISTVMMDSTGEKKTIAQILDITEQKQAKQEKIELAMQLQRAQKMEALGTLAGGVAHDLNNILTGLVSYPELLLMDLPDDSPFRKPILTIQKSGERAAAIVQDLLTLARRGVSSTEVVNINHIVQGYLKSPEFENLKLHCPKAQVETGLDPDLLNILGSRVHLSKTVMNLISNAAEAMPDGGKISISTENRYIDRPIRGYDQVAEGDYVIFSISDTGIGIAPVDLERIFEPFYTKKVMGRSGTGLGMAVVWGTVKDHNGYIDVESIVGQGTTFSLYFPVTRKKLDSDAEMLKMEDYKGNGESILIVDDVEEQQGIAKQILRKLGYSVDAVSSGEEAVAYMKEKSIDLLVLDMIMDPGMDGLETYKEIIKLHPGQKALIVSGFSETARVREAQRLGAGTYVRKPYLLSKFGMEVRRELEKS